MDYKNVGCELQLKLSFSFVTLLYILLRTEYFFFSVFQNIGYVKKCRLRRSTSLFFFYFSYFVVDKPANSWSLLLGSFVTLPI